MKKNNCFIRGFCVLIAAGVLAGCGNESIQTVEAQPKEIVEEYTESVQTIEAVEIEENDIKQLLAGNIDRELEIKSHEICVADETNSAGGKYDLMDKVNVTISFSDEFDVIPQTINKDVYFMREAESGQWKIVRENCKKWDTKFKQFGGTSWKMATEGGDIYFRLRDTIEFFATQPDKLAEKVEETGFSTTILGAMYMYVDGEPELRRIHVMSGTLSENGDIELYIEFVHTDESIEIRLNDCEKIEREELPFTEEEFRTISDQLG